MTAIDPSALRDELHAWFRRRVRDPHEAEDLVQETLLRVAKGLPGVRAHERLHAWCWRIAQNVLADALRRRRATTPLDPDLASPDAEEDPQRVVASWLRPMLDELPAADREVLLLSEFEGLPAREIAARLAANASTIGSRIARARKKLERVLLACCRIEFDRTGRVSGWRKNACSGCDPEPGGRPA